uniref:NAD-dependent epimerase/dehydratase domain-containing protein n=1 Tax=Tetradesmus obliquus TaxID=3088 RepID=A0A383WD53_TETOB|eukprot:jgi/Sobl393_1/885/SZX75547.1
MANQSLFIFGLGYTSTGIARQAQARDISVVSTARRVQQFAPLASETHKLLLFDPAGKQQLNEDGMQALQQATYVVTSIPPVAAKLYDPVLQAQHRALREAAAAPGCQIRGLGYLSSTGKQQQQQQQQQRMVACVYGDWQGAWVDESCEPRTATGRGVVRLEAEAAWAALAQQLQLPLTIFRLGGIYGPRRSVLHNLQTQAKPNRSAARRGEQRFTSRCHVADVVQAVLADMQRRRLVSSTTLPAGTCEPHLQQQQQQQEEGGQGFTWPGLQVGSRYVDVINVVDDEPAPRGDVEQYALQLLGGSQAGGLPEDRSSSSSANQEPQQEQGSSSSSRGSRRAEVLEEKRVRNDRLKAQLGVQLLAPTYREGLAAMHAGSIAPFAAEDLECLFAGGSE